MPGVNPPTGIEPEEMTRPTGELIIGAPASTAAAGGDSAIPVGIWESGPIGAPQVEQKRLSAGTSLEHEGHFISSPIFAIADQDQVLIYGTARQDQPIVRRPVKIPNLIRCEVG